MKPFTTTTTTYDFSIIIIVKLILSELYIHAMIFKNVTGF